MRKIAAMALMLGISVLIAETVSAASISTRVRILEKKVRKHDQAIRANSHGLKQQRKKVEGVDKKIRHLSGRVDQLEKALKAIHKPKQDKRYTYP
ncbi:MAG TPA: hypothetical protein EYP05_07990 [Piscirickettsiaceae bacterium]|nr:hypothetical protein [Piscirickettsiaceae bacterium]HIQ39702.1 hypothetical protein [Sulfurivirga caldicuralii]